MSINLLAKPSGTQGALQLNGVDAVVYDSTGIVSGVNKSAVSQSFTLGTVANTTSGTAFTFGSIPSWVRRITLSVVGVQATSTTSPILQLGTSGGIEATNYLGSTNAIVTNACGGASLSTSFAWDYTTGASANIWHGVIVLTCVDPSTFKWSCLGNLSLSNAQSGRTIAGSKTLAAALTQIQISVAAGAFNAGAINILYE